MWVVNLVIHVPKTFCFLYTGKKIPILCLVISLICWLSLCTMLINCHAIIPLAKNWESQTDSWVGQVRLVIRHIKKRPSCNYFLVKYWHSVCPQSAWSFSFSLSCPQAALSVCVELVLFFRRPWVFFFVGCMARYCLALYDELFCSIVNTINRPAKLFSSCG